MPREHFRLLRVLRKIRSFSLVEVLLVVAILSVIIGICLYAMNAAQVSYNLTLAQRNLQSEVRRTIGWIVKDVRQAVSSEMAKSINTPTPDHIKILQVVGWDPLKVPPSFLYSDYYIEYTYDAVNHTIIRRTSNVIDNTTIGVWTLNNVNTSPFFTINSLGETVPLNKEDLLRGQLVITISGKSSMPNLEDIAYSLTERVQIRNGQ